MYCIHLFTEVTISVLYDAPSKSNTLHNVLITISVTTNGKYFLSCTIEVLFPLFTNQYNNSGSEMLTEKSGNRGKKKISKRIKLKQNESNLSSDTSVLNKMFLIFANITFSTGIELFIEAFSTVKNLLHNLPYLRTPKYDFAQ